MKLNEIILNQSWQIMVVYYDETGSKKLVAIPHDKILYCPPILVDKTNFNLGLYKHANFYRFEESSSYWSMVTHIQHHSVWAYSDEYLKHCAGRAYLQ